MGNHLQIKGKTPLNILIYVTINRQTICTGPIFVPKDPDYIYLSFATGTIEYDHYARECEFGILKKKKRRRNTIPLFGVLQDTTVYVWYLQYWALCDALVNFKL